MMMGGSRRQQQESRSRQCVATVTIKKPFGDNRRYKSGGRIFFLAATNAAVACLLLDSILIERTAADY